LPASRGTEGQPSLFAHLAAATRVWLNNGSRMRWKPHVRFCERLAMRLRRATHPVVGFEHETDARRFLDMMRTRLEEFALSLHPEKTRLTGFVRHASCHVLRIP
jgi:hypothetical protein